MYGMILVTLLAVLGLDEARPATCEDGRAALETTGTKPGLIMRSSNRRSMIWRAAGWYPSIPSQKNSAGFKDSAAVRIQDRR